MRDEATAAGTELLGGTAAGTELLVWVVVDAAVDAVESHPGRCGKTLASTDLFARARRRADDSVTEGTSGPSATGGPSAESILTCS